MKKNKELQKIVRKLADISFKENRLVESSVIKSIKILKSLSRQEAINGLSEYLKEVRRIERAHTLHIETSSPLTQIQINQARKIVEKKVKITKVLVSINPQILGGFKLKIGDEIYDESLIAKINQIKEVITNGRFSQSN